MRPFMVSSVIRTFFSPVQEVRCKVKQSKRTCLMKVIELLKIDQLVLQLLQESCVKVGDVRYVGLYEEYMRIVKEGWKVSYTVAYLAEKYAVSERQVYYIIKKFSEDCNILAV